MTKSFAIFGFLACTTPAFGFDLTPPPVRPRAALTIQSLYPDVFPNDGVLDAGSLSNPLTIEGRNGARYEIKTLFPDVFQDDGVLDAGSISNPWGIEPLD